MLDICSTSTASNGYNWCGAQLERNRHGLGRLYVMQSFSFFSFFLLRLRKQENPYGNKVFFLSLSPFFSLLHNLANNHTSVISFSIQSIRVFCLPFISLSLYYTNTLKYQHYIHIPRNQIDSTSKRRKSYSNDGFWFPFVLQTNH